jgi:phosphoglycerol transferase MdoB-like AlkP superfamily enzyme
LAKLYIVSLAIFSFFRVILFTTEITRLNEDKADTFTILQAFIMGVRFDLVITSYILLLPAVLFSILYFLNKKYPFIEKAIFVYIFILSAIAFILSAVDIPYFNQFFSRLNIGALEWADSPSFVFKMVIQEPRYFLIFIPFIIVLFIFYKFLKSVFNKLNIVSNTKLYLKLLFTVLLLGGILIAMRGRFQLKSPIRVGTAYFSNNAFLNQLGLNPTYTFIRSYIDSKSSKNAKVDLMKEQEAIERVKLQLGILDSISDSPIARNIIPDSLSTNRPNVVIIMMESMSAAKMKRHGNNKNLAPFLDSLSYQSIYFENIFTAGIHTFNGVFSTLFSLPGLYRQHPLKDIRKYNGISNELKKHGYTTSYFTTHDGQFDNVEGFLKANSFDFVYSQDDYPQEEVKTTLGVPDDYLFRHAIPIIDDFAKESKPFFASFMTVSDHGPYYIPPYFTPKSKDIKDQIVEYADWSLQQFIYMASKKPWFDNTIFVFIADHGAPLTAYYDISLDYHHSPLIFYAPKILDKPASYENIGGQIDVFPTIMGMLNLAYINNTLGIDLLKEERPFIYFNADDKVGVIDEEYFYILKKGFDSQLFEYRNYNKVNLIDSFPSKAKEMDTYARSNMQVFQSMLSSNQTYVDKPIIVKVK